MAWNDEALRWSAERVDVAAELFRVEANACPSLSESRVAHGPQAVSTLSAADMLSADAGLTACSVLAHLAEDQMDVDAAVAEARERVRWLSNVTRRRAAIAALCDEQRAAFVEQWRRRAAGAAASALPPTAAPSAEPT